MTVADRGATSGDGRWPFRLAMLLGHFYRRQADLLMVAVWALLIAGWWASPAAGLLKALALALACVAIASSACEMFVHDRNLCLRDLQEAPLLDPQGAVDKNRSRLRTFHDRRFKVVVLTMSAGPLLAVLLVPGRESMSTTLRVVSTVVAVVGIAVLAFAGRLSAVHRRLRPWCPWCRRDGGPDDPVVAPTPDPAGTARR